MRNSHAIRYPPQVFTDPNLLANQLNLIEDVERTTARYVAEAIVQIVPVAVEQFNNVQAAHGALEDRADYLGEDLTRMAMRRLGEIEVPDSRIFGAVDYKLATYRFMPDFAVRQALFIDSKAERGALSNLRMQVSQTSLEIRQVRQGEAIRVQGGIPRVWADRDVHYLTTTMFVKWHYNLGDPGLDLERVSIISLPSGFLQDHYNPDENNSIWNVGPDSPERGEKFRTRISFSKLEEIAPWRVQRITPAEDWMFLT